jgi:hypothetical protein
MNPDEPPEDPWTDLERDFFAAWIEPALRPVERLDDLEPLDALDARPAPPRLSERLRALWRRVLVTIGFLRPPLPRDASGRPVRRPGAGRSRQRRRRRHR